MFRHILVPVDLTEKNRSAIAAAADLAKAGSPEDQSSIALLHVIETIRDVPFEELADFYQRLEDKARTEMTELADALADQGIAVEQHISYGSRAKRIVAHAGEHGSDLIVVSTARLDQPEASWTGIGHQVALLAPCPVLLIK